MKDAVVARGTTMAVLTRNGQHGRKGTSWGASDHWGKEGGVDLYMSVPLCEGGRQWQADMADQLPNAILSVPRRVPLAFEDVIRPWQAEGPIETLAASCRGIWSLLCRLALRSQWAKRTPCGYWGRGGGRVWRLARERPIRQDPGLRRGGAGAAGFA